MNERAKQLEEGLDLLCRALVRLQDKLIRKSDLPGIQAQQLLIRLHAVLLAESNLLTYIGDLGQ